MENSDPKFSENPEGQAKPIEHDYSKHETDPGPSPQAVKEQNNKGAGPTMKWIIPILLIVMAILYYIFFQHHPTK